MSAAWDFFEPSKRYVNVTVNGRPLALYNDASIEIFGHADDIEILIVPPPDAGSPMPQAISRTGTSRAVPGRLRQPLPPPPPRTT